MPRLLVVAAVIAIAAVIYALVDCLQSPRSEVRRLPKPVWILVILLVPVIGAVAWMVAGRPTPDVPGPPAPLRRPVAPDDDPAFLQQLRSIDEEHERMLRQWERDLRRREGKREDPGGDAGTGGAGGTGGTGLGGPPPDDEGRGPDRAV